MSIMDLQEWQKKAEEETRRLKRVEDTVKKNNELLRYIVKEKRMNTKFSENIFKEFKKLVELLTQINKERKEEK